MKKKEFTELIRISLVNDVNPAVVEKYISMAYDTFVLKHWASRKTSNIDLYTKLFREQDIVGLNGEYFTMLPASIIDIPITGSGVASVEMTGEIGSTFVPATIDQIKNLSNLEVGLMKGNYWYVVLQDRIQFIGKMYGITKVNLRLVLKYDSYLPDDEIYFAPNSEISIRDIVWQFLRQTPIEDRVIDSNEKTR